MLLFALPIAAVCSFSIESAFLMQGSVEWDPAFSVHGRDQGDRLGISISVADLDGDGYEEVLAGAPFAGLPGIVNGEVLVFSGRDGSQVLLLTNSVPSKFGHAIDARIDINGDGYLDIIVGAPETEIHGAAFAGQAFIFSGNTGAALLQVDGSAPFEQLGMAVSGLGDQNSDGVPDFVIGSPGAAGGGMAIAYSGLDGSQLWQAGGGSATQDKFGDSLLLIPDINQDGFPDLLIGAPEGKTSSQLLAGYSALVSGLTGSEILRVEGDATSDGFGSALGVLDDIDSDGIPDFIIGAPRADPGGRIQAGSVSIVSGASGLILNVLEGSQAEEQFGSSLSPISDVDFDGVTDFLVGSEEAGAFGFGSAGLVSVISSSSLEVLSQFGGLAADDRFGSSVAGLNDSNGDGLPEIAIGARGADPMGVGQAGEIIVLQSRPDSDHDGLPDYLEDVNENGIVDVGETNPLDQDSDDDGLGDGEEAQRQWIDDRWLQSPSGRWYRIAPKGAWSESSGDARRQGYELTSVHNSMESNWLFSEFVENWGELYIGLSDFSGTFEWSDGSSVGYTNWASTEPSSNFVSAFIGSSASSEPGRWYGESSGLANYHSIWHWSGGDEVKGKLDPLDSDTDGDGLPDGLEVGRDSIIWDGDLDGDGLPDVGGTDPLLFIPDMSPASVTDPLNLDSDDDGLADGLEDADINGAIGPGETNPAQWDSDLDGLSDGLESGVATPLVDSNPLFFMPDSDPLTTTFPLVQDSDGGGIPDGSEDVNRDGFLDTWETDPNSSADDAFCFYLTKFQPGQALSIEIWNATPSTWIFPAYSLAGNSPTQLGIGVMVNLTPPINTLSPWLSDQTGRVTGNGPLIPAGAPLGLLTFWQAIEVPLTPHQSPRVTNAITIPVGAL